MRTCKRIISKGLMIALLIQMLTLNSFAEDSKLIMSATSGYAGDKVTTSGTFTPNEMIVIKVLNMSSDIIYINTVLSNANGKYSDTFTVPDINAGIIKVIVGYGSDVVNANFTIKVKSIEPIGHDDSASENHLTTGMDLSKTNTITAENKSTISVYDATGEKSAELAVKSTSNTISAETIVTITAADMNYISEEFQNKKSDLDGISRIEINVVSTTMMNTVKVRIPSESLKVFMEGVNTKLRIKTDLGIMNFDENAFKSIVNAHPLGTLSIHIEKVDKKVLSDLLKEKVANRPVYDFTIRVDDQIISDFESGCVEITIPYNLNSGEEKHAIVVYAIDALENLNVVRGQFDSDSKSITFVTKQSSKYMMGYHKIVFSDVKDTAWYSDAITYISAREIASGTSANHYGPELKLTRAQFLVMIMRAYSIEAVKGLEDNFEDAGSTYYTDYLGTAKRLGISSGIGHNRFGVDQEITRQEMVTMLYNTLKTMGQLPILKEGKSLTDFSDVNQIADWAKEAMTLFVKNGIVTGKNGELSPMDTATRAEMAQVIYNLFN